MHQQHRAPFRIIASLLPVLTLLGCTTSPAAYDDLLQNHPPVPSEVQAIWFGNASIAVSDGNTTLLIDPFVTRPELGSLIFNTPIEPSQDLISEWITKLGILNADAVFVSHSHYDHLLDAPLFAKMTGASLYGSESTLQAGLGAGLPTSKLYEVELDAPICIGEFQIRMLPSRHGKVLWNSVPYPGIIEAPIVPPAPASHYRVGQTYQILIHHLGSGKTMLLCMGPGWLPDVNNRPENQAEVVFLGVGGLKSKHIQAYLEAVPLASNAVEIIPIHFDNATKPLSEPIVLLPGVKLYETAKAAREHGLEVRTLPVGKPQRVFIDRTSSD